MVEVTQERVVQAAVGGRGTICGSLAVVVMGVSRGVMKGAISEGKSCAITWIIAHPLRLEIRSHSPRRRPLVTTAAGNLRVGMARRMAQNGAPPTRPNARAATPAVGLQDRRCGICEGTSHP